MYRHFISLHYPFHKKYSPNIPFQQKTQYLHIINSYQKLRTIKYKEEKRKNVTTQLHSSLVHHVHFTRFPPDNRVPG